MDKRTATLNLANALRGKGYVNIVTDPVIKSNLLDNANHYVLDLETAGRMKIFIASSINMSTLEKTSGLADALPYNIRNNCPTANYLFLEGGKEVDDSYRGTCKLRNSRVTPSRRR